MGHSSALARMQGQCLCKGAREWEDAWGAVAQCSMSKGRIAEDTAWRAADKAEGRVADWMHALTMLWEIKQFCENLHRDLLYHASQALQRPLHAIRLALHMCPIPRRIFLDGAVGPRIDHSKGIVAGSKTATTEANMHAMPMLQDVSSITDEEAASSSHIDDITSSS
eukprot:8609424-Pyramimonas_sp.AAC.1